MCVAVMTTLPPLDVTVYPVIPLPPVDEGAVKLTIACILPATAVTLVGAPGTVVAADVLKVNSVPYDVPAALVA